MTKGKLSELYVQFPLMRLFRNNTTRRVLWWVIFFLLSFIILSTNFIPDQVTLEAGEIAQKDVFYRGATVTYTSELKTGESRRFAAQGVAPIYQVNSQVVANLESAIKNVFTALTPIQQDDELEPEQKKEKINALFVEPLPANTTELLLNADAGTMMMLEDKLISIVKGNMEEGVLEEELDTVNQEILANIETLEIAAPLKDFLKGVVEQLKFEPNRIYDPVATAQEVENRLARVKPVQVKVRPGEKIVEKGTVVTPEQIEALQFLGLQRTSTPVLTFIGLFGFVAIIYGLVIIYLKGYKSRFHKRESNIVLLGLLINVSLVIAKIITAIQISDKPEIAAQLGYAIPVAACSMLMAILMDTRTAVLITVVLGLLMGVITNGQVVYVTVAIISGLVGVYRVAKLSQRSHLVRCSVDIGLASALTIVVLGLIWNQPLSLIGIGASMGIINGVLASVLTIGTLPFLETAFGITTPVKLLELSNPSHPLLKRLMVEAPGTYHHSILVGNLAEAAADAIGADSLLVRVGSYFHDIGKIKRPYFFIENQPAMENPHDKITPTLSTLIITSHIKDGVELAKEYKFPRVIRDIIEQHHGTCLVSYFYHKAKEGDKSENILESDFRYQAPKPQNRETAIIMLADSVQAAVQVLEKPTKGILEAKVREIIKAKLEDGQLNECDLTFKDIDIINQSFVRVLNGIFHSRIEYPDQVTKEMEKGKPKNIKKVEVPDQSLKETERGTQSGTAIKEPAGQSGNYTGDGKTSFSSDS
ncbi:MAG: HD family phosphohydrolase [Bacillota bacterium]|jgi:putative nucleotidyltransferase with HDIG domain